MLSWAEARARALGEPAVGQAKTDANETARALLLGNGYEPTFTSWLIRIGLDEPPTGPVIPEGISIRSYDSSDARAVHELIDTAFCEWPGRDPEPYEVWASDVLAHPAFAPEIWPLAFDGVELVGVVLSFDYPERDEGWIIQLATKATASTRDRAGAAPHVLGWFHERGRRAAGVATDSRTGALDLYEKVGMRAQRQYTRYTKRLT